MNIRTITTDDRAAAHGYLTAAAVGSTRPLGMVEQAIHAVALAGSARAPLAVLASLCDLASEEIACDGDHDAWDVETYRLRTVRALALRYQPDADPGVLPTPWDLAEGLPSADALGIGGAYIRGADLLPGRRVARADRPIHDTGDLY